MAASTGDRGTIQPLLNGLPNDIGVKLCAGVVVTDGTVGNLLHAVQSVNVSSARQAAGTGVAENRGVAGVAGGAGAVDDPVVVRRHRIMPRCAVRMAVIAGIVTRIGRGHIVPDVTLTIPKRESAGVAAVIVTCPAVDG